MKLISSRPLTNHEALLLIQNQNTNHFNQDHHQTIHHIIQYLQTHKYQDTQEIATILKSLNQFPLSQTEKIHLINVKPTQIIDVHLILNDEDEKLDMEQKQSILELFQ